MRTNRGAHDIGYYKRVNVPWFIVLSAFVNSCIPPIVHFGVLTSSIGTVPSVHRIATPFDEQVLRPDTNKSAPLRRGNNTCD